MTKPFDPTKPVQTKAGDKVRIICYDKRGNMPIVALIRFDDTTEQLNTYTNDGHFHWERYDSPYDLINIPPKVINEIYYNTYLDGTNILGYKTLDAANAHKESNRLGVVKFTMYDDSTFDVEKVCDV